MVSIQILMKQNKNFRNLKIIIFFSKCKKILDENNSLKLEKELLNVRY